MVARILEVSDMLEEGIRKFIKENPRGGNYVFPAIDRYLAIPLMISIFEDEGWSIAYDYDDDNEWLEIKKPSQLLLGSKNG